MNAIFKRSSVRKYTDEPNITGPQRYDESRIHWL